MQVSEDIKSSQVGSEEGRKEVMLMLMPDRLGGSLNGWRISKALEEKVKDECCDIPILILDLVAQSEINQYVIKNFFVLLLE